MSAASKAHTDALVADLEHDLLIMRTSRELYSAKAITRHEEIVSRLNAHAQLVEALQECIYEISSNKQFAGSVALEPSANTKRILRKARAALSHLTTRSNT